MQKSENHIELDLFALHAECLIKQGGRSITASSTNTPVLPWTCVHVCLSAGLSMVDGLTARLQAKNKAKANGEIKISDMIDSAGVLVDRCDLNQSVLAKNKKLTFGKKTRPVNEFDKGLRMMSMPI